MRVAYFSTKSYDRRSFDSANDQERLEVVYFESRLTHRTVDLAKGFDAVCAFVNDQLDREVLQRLKEGGVKIIALRSAGFNHVDIKSAGELDLTIVRVPAYSPYAVAEHTLALILSLNRKIHRAYNRVREGNFALDGLLGFDIHQKTVGIIGTGKIGEVFAKLLTGFGCTILGYDPYPSEEARALGLEYVELEELFKRSDIISLHCPLTPQTHHLIDEKAIALMKEGVMLINTSRGGLVDTRAVIRGLKSQKIGALGLDVYEEESELFFEDLSGEVLQDDIFARLLTFPNVIITGHQGFFTTEAVGNIAQTTYENLIAFFFNEGEYFAV